MSFTLQNLMDTVWPYYRPAWIRLLREYGLEIPEDIDDDKLKVLIRLWNEAREES